jgi:photosystem II stability/assembly factor-like uncharacterized protein
MNEMERDLRDLGHRYWSDDSALRPEAPARGAASRHGRSLLPSGLIAAGTAVFLVVVLIGGILVTRSRTSTPTPAVVTGSIESLQMLSPSEGWGWSRNLVARTSDGGATFDVVTPPVLTPALEIWSMTAVDIDHAWVVVTNASGPLTTTRLYRTVDGGATWVALPFSVKANWITEGPTFIDSLHGWALTVDQTYNPPTSDVVLLRTVDGGESWSTVYETTARLTVSGTPAQTGDCQFGLPVFTSPNFGVDALTDCPGYSPSIAMTRDGGNTWRRVRVPSPDTDSPAGAAMSSGTAAPVFTSPTTGSVFSTVCVTITADECATYGAFFHTTDGGARWSPTTTLRIGSDLPVLSQGETWLVNACIGLCKSWEGTPSLLLHTDDEGTHWTSSPLASPLVLGGLHASHAFQFVDAEDGFDVTSGEFNRPMFYRTTDGGVTWSAFTPRFIAR